MSLMTTDIYIYRLEGVCFQQTLVFVIDNICESLLAELLYSFKTDCIQEFLGEERKEANIILEQHFLLQR